MIIKDFLKDHDTFFRERVIPKAAEHVETLRAVIFDDMFYHRFKRRAVFKISIDASLDRTLECYYRNTLFMSYLNKPVDDFPCLYHLSENNNAGKIHPQKKVCKIKL